MTNTHTIAKKLRDAGFIKMDATRIENLGDSRHFEVKHTEAEAIKVRFAGKIAGLERKECTQTTTIFYY